MLSQARGEGDGGYMSKSAVRTVFSEISFHTTGHQRYETTGRPPSVRVAEETQNTDLNQVPLWLLFD